MITLSNRQYNSDFVNDSHTIELPIVVGPNFKLYTNPNCFECYDCLNDVLEYVHKIS